jgi:hypothetical protein
MSNKAPRSDDPHFAGQQRVIESIAILTNGNASSMARILIWMLLTGAWMVGVVCGDDSLRIGAAEVEITPPLGYPMAGYYHERLAAGVRDPLKVKAIVLLGAKTQAALVVCDLTGIAVDLSTEVRRRAAEKTGIPPGNIVVAATHSHTAPDYTKNLYEHLGGNESETKSVSNERQAYAGTLIGGISEAVTKAHAAARPAVVRAGSAAQETPVSFNRRFVMRDGSVQTWQSLSNPQVVRPAGPIDPEIGLLEVRDAQSDAPLAVVSNFALHLDTVGGMEWSADYPFFIERAVRESLGPDVVSIFGLGCCGDLNHVNPAANERNRTDYIGNALGATIRHRLPQLKNLDEPTLQFRSATVPLPLRDVTAVEAKRAAELLRAVRNGVKAEFFDQVTAYRNVILDQLRHRPPYVSPAEHISWGASRTWQGIGESLPVEVNVFTLGGDVAIVCLPGEVFVELGLAIKQASPFPITLVIELSQAVETAYIPTRAAYAGGGYEVTNSTLQPGGGEMLVEAALRLLRESAAVR